MVTLEVSFYNKDKLDELLEDDEISVEEQGFMEGYNGAYGEDEGEPEQEENI